MLLDLIKVVIIYTYFVLNGYQNITKIFNKKEIVL